MPILDSVKSECRKLGMTPGAQKVLEERLMQNFPALQSGYDRILGFTEDEKGLLKVIRQLIDLAITHKGVSRKRLSNRVLAVRSEGRSLSKVAKEALRAISKSEVRLYVKESLQFIDDSESHFVQVGSALPNVHTLIKNTFVGKATILIDFDIKQTHSHAIAEFLYACKQIIQPALTIIVKPVPGIGWRYYSDKSWYHHRECDVVFNEAFTAAIWDAIATKNTTILSGILDGLDQDRPESFFSVSPGYVTFTFEDEAIQASGYTPELHRKFLREFYTFNFPGTMSTVRLVYKEGINVFHGELAGLSGYKKATELKDKTWIDLSLRRLDLIQTFAMVWGNYTELVDVPAYPAVNTRLWKLAIMINKVFGPRTKKPQVIPFEDRNILKLVVKQGSRKYYAWFNFSPERKQLKDSALNSRISKLKNKDLLGKAVKVKSGVVDLEPYRAVLA